MNLKRKLIISVLTLVFAFSSLVVSTYAWLSLSQTATVSELSLTVTSEDSLLIAHSASEPDAADYSVRYVVNLSKQLYPASTVNLTNWYKAEAADSDAYDPLIIDNEDTYTALDTTNATDFAKYVFVDSEFWVKYMGETATKDLYISEITLALPNTGVTDIYKSLRIGVKTGSDFYIYATNTAATNNKGVDSATTTTTITNWTLTEAANRTDVFTTLTKNVAKNIVVYVWFEGEDSNNYTNNLNINACNMSFKFSIADRG